MNNTAIECLNFILKINGTNYPLSDINTIQFSAGRNKRLVRGLGGNNKHGILVNENLDTADTYTIETFQIDEPFYRKLKDIFNDKGDTRIDIFYYDKVKKKSYTVEDCALTTNPQQSDYASAEYFKTTITLQSYDDNI